MSVIMNCRNGEPFLREALDSVLAQTVSDWEIIFYDNQSTDDSASIARQYEGRLIYSRSPRALPLGSARNRAASLARGEYLAFLDTDDVWRPDKLRDQLDAFSVVGERETGLVFTDALRIDAQGASMAGFAHERPTPPDGDMFAPLLEDCFLALSSCMVPRHIVEQFGGFNEDLEFVEEWDLWLRIARQYDVRRVPKELTSIRFHETNTSRDFMGQREEVLRLLRGITVASSEAEAARRRGIARFELRYTLMELLDAVRRGPVTLLRHGLPALMLMVSNPGVTMSTLSRYLRPSMLRLLAYKRPTR